MTSFTSTNLNDQHVSNEQAKCFIKMPVFGKSVTNENLNKIVSVIKQPNTITNSRSIISSKFPNMVIG